MPNPTEEFARILKHVPLFANLSERHLKKFADRFIERRFAVGEKIVEQGKSGIGMYIIVEGRTRVARVDENGATIELGELGPMDFFGELALLKDAPRSATVTAVEDTTCLAIRKLDFLDEVESEPVVAIEMLKELAGRLQDTLEKL